MRLIQRLGAYAVVRPEPGSDDVVLVQASQRSDHAGQWFLPGGGVDHGEHPDAAVVREVMEETGLEVRVDGLTRALTDVTDLPHRGVRVHTVRLIYRVSVTGGALREEIDGSASQIAVLSTPDAATLSLAPYVARALDLAVVRPPPISPALHALQPLSGVGGADSADRAAAARRLRIGVYGVAVRGEGDHEEVLLTRLADRIGADRIGADRIGADRIGGVGRWTLPGGGLDHGETVEAGLRREVHEETGLDVTSAELLAVSSTHFTGHAPSGVLEDFHGVRVVHQIRTSAGVPRVIEVGGSTAEATWVPTAGLVDLPVVSLVDEALTMLEHQSARNIAG